MKKEIGVLHVITDFHFQQRFSHAELARLVIDGGADTIQFRQKTGAARHKLVSARRAAAECAASSVPFIVDDDLDIALASGADGIHLGKEDFPIDEARRLAGDGFILGATAASVEDAVRAVSKGADYIGFGPVFTTRSKSNPAPVQGIDALRKVCRSVEVPVIAIAGITAARVTEVVDAGAHGVAVMTFVSTAPDPRAAAAELREQLELCL